MKRIFDLFAGIVLLVLLVIPMLLIYIAVRLSSKGLALHWSDRVGKNNTTGACSSTIVKSIMFLIETD